MSNPLFLVYSGGSSNTNPNLSLGGSSSCYKTFVRDDLYFSGMESLSGISVYSVEGVKEGYYQVLWRLGYLTWVCDSISFESPLLEGDSLVSLGSIATGFVHFSIDWSNIPRSDVTDCLVISKTQPTIPSKLRSDYIQGLESLSGVSLLHSNGSFYGESSLSWNVSTRTLVWEVSGLTFSSVEITSNVGIVFLGSPDFYLILKVTPSQLPLFSLSVPLFTSSYTYYDSSISYTKIYIEGLQRFSGIKYIDSWGVLDGSSTLYWDSQLSSLYWVPPGTQTIYTSEVLGLGYVVLGSSVSGYLVLDVDPSLLPSFGDSTPSIHNRFKLDLYFSRDPINSGISLNAGLSLGLFHLTGLYFLKVENVLESWYKFSWDVGSKQLVWLGLDNTVLSTVTLNSDALVRLRGFHNSLFCGELILQVNVSSLPTLSMVDRFYIKESSVLRYEPSQIVTGFMKYPGVLPIFCKGLPSGEHVLKWNYPFSTFELILSGVSYYSIVTSSGDYCFSLFSSSFLLFSFDSFLIQSSSFICSLYIESYKPPFYSSKKDMFSDESILGVSVLGVVGYERDEFSLQWLTIPRTLTLSTIHDVSTSQTINSDGTFILGSSSRFIIINVVLTELPSYDHTISGVLGVLHCAPFYPSQSFTLQDESTFSSSTFSVMYLYDLPFESVKISRPPGEDNLRVIMDSIGLPVFSQTIVFSEYSVSDFKEFSFSPFSKSWFVVPISAHLGEVDTYALLSIDPFPFQEVGFSYYSCTSPIPGVSLLYYRNHSENSLPFTISWNASLSELRFSAYSYVYTYNSFSKVITSSGVWVLKYQRDVEPWPRPDDNFIVVCIHFDKLPSIDKLATYSISDFNSLSSYTPYLSLVPGVSGCEILYTTHYVGFGVLSWDSQAKVFIFTYHHPSSTPISYISSTVTSSSNLLIGDSYNFIVLKINYPSLPSTNIISTVVISTSQSDNIQYPLNEEGVLLGSSNLQGLSVKRLLNIREGPINLLWDAGSSVLSYRRSSTIHTSGIIDSGVLELLLGSIEDGYIFLDISYNTLPSESIGYLCHFSLLSSLTKEPIPSQFFSGGSSVPGCNILAVGGFKVGLYNIQYDSVLSRLWIKVGDDELYHTISSQDTLSLLTNGTYYLLLQVSYSLLSGSKLPLVGYLSQDGVSYPNSSLSFVRGIKNITGVRINCSKEVPLGLTYLSWYPLSSTLTWDIGSLGSLTSIVSKRDSVVLLGTLSGISLSLQIDYENLPLTSQEDVLLSVDSGAQQSLVGSQIVVGVEGISGLSVLHASNNPVGVGTLTWFYNRKVLVWSTSLGQSNSIVTPAMNAVSLVSDTTGFLHLSVTYSLLPLFDVEVNVSVDDLFHTLFHKPSPAQLVSGFTDYRCLYLFNYSDRDVSSISLSVFKDDIYGEISVGTEFLPEVSTNVLSTIIDYKGVYSVKGVCSINYSFYNSFNSTDLHIKSDSGGPLYFISRGGLYRCSDGVLGYTPSMLFDMFDSTNLLSHISWGLGLNWNKISPNSGVSFWIKRIVYPNSSIPPDAFGELSLTITYL